MTTILFVCLAILAYALGRSAAAKRAQRRAARAGQVRS
jgi:hypothetical protein